MKKIALLVCLVYGFYGKAVAQTWQDTVRRIDSLFSRYQPNRPGCQFSISRNGQIIYSKAWGMADLEHSVPLTTNSIIEAGSVSKQFTAAAILLLEQQGKLSLNDDVRKYIPELPDYGTVIKLRHLLHHTSGLRDWGAIAELAGWPRTTKTYSNNDALRILQLQKGLNNKPGDEYMYSNSNYNLFAIIVQRVSGLSLADYTRRYIFEPAGMKNTQWRDNFKRIVPNRAIAYDLVNGSYETDMPNEYAYGNGGLLTTTEDLLRWNTYYLGGKFGSPSLLARQTRPDTLNNGQINNYGAGLTIGEYFGANYYYHDGATASYRSLLAGFPKVNVSFAWLSNTSQFDTASVNIFKKLQSLLFYYRGRKYYENQIGRADVAASVPEAVLKGYEGDYRNGQLSALLSIRYTKKGLTAEGQLLLAVTKNKFNWGGRY